MLRITSIVSSLSLIHISVTATDLAEALAANGLDLDRKLIAVEGIKTVGEYEATAKLHKEVKAVIKFSVTAAE